MGTNSSFRVCDQCNQRIPADSMFCPECGAALRPTRLSRSARMTGGGGQSSSALWGLVGAGVVLAVVLVVIHHGHHASVAAGGAPKTTATSPGSQKKSSSTSPKGQTSSSKPKPKAKTIPPKVHHAVKPSKPTVKPKKKTTTPKSSPPKVSSTPPTIQTGFSTASIGYQGATIGLTLPNTLDQVKTKVASDEWQFANQGNAGYNVTVTALPPSSSPPGGTTAFGPDAYGTPITRQGDAAQQTLYIDWTGHAWVAVSMTVPAKDESWLGTIAQSVRIS